MRTADYSRIATIEAFDNMEVLETRLTDRQFPLHFHDTFVIQLIKSGADVCRGTGLSACASNVFVHTPNASHAGGPASGKSLEYQAIYPSRKLASQILGVEQDDMPEISFVSESVSLRRSVQGFFAAQTENDREKKLKQVLFQVYEQANSEKRRQRNCQSSCQCSSDNQSTSGAVDDLTRAKAYLVENCHRDISIEELSGICYLSKFHLIRVFKRKFGITPRQFLINQRVLLAKQLLARGEAIATTALSAGFSDQSHLNRCFKRITGFNPGQYANGCRSN